MVKAVAEFLAGAAVILTPQYQIPLLLGSAAVKVGTSIAKQRKKDEEHKQKADSNGKSTSQQLTLEWDDLSVAIHSKKSDRLVPIFSDLSGSARPGRQATSASSLGLKCAGLASSRTPSEHTNPCVAILFCRKGLCVCSSFHLDQNIRIWHFSQYYLHTLIKAFSVVWCPLPSKNLMQSFRLARDPVGITNSSQIAPPA